jgi:hypothetical protein
MFDRRLGILGLLMAAIGIGIAVLFPTHYWIGWLSFGFAGIVAIYWLIWELTVPTPSFPFVFGAPLGDNNSADWIMMVKHYGPNPAYNCDIAFYDKDRTNINHLWLVDHPNVPFAPKDLVGETRTLLQCAEVGKAGSSEKFTWKPLDPDCQRYSVASSCRDGVFSQEWEVTRVDGVLRSRLIIKQGAEVIFSCVDPEFTEKPLLAEIPTDRKPVVHPGWKPNHLFKVPSAIIDSNYNVQVVSAVKMPDGSTRSDFGCWNILTRHYGDKVSTFQPMRVLRTLLRFAAKRKGSTNTL